MSSKAKDAQAAPVILEYLKKQNRPYSATDIHSNLHNMFGKTAVVKALDAMAAEGKIRSKTYNKQVVYVADQAELADVDADELKEMDGTITQLTEEYNSLNSTYKELEKKLNAFKSTFTTEEGKDKVSATEASVKALCTKLDCLKNNQSAVSPEERTQVKVEHEKFSKEMLKRKRMVREMVNAVLEGYPHSKRRLLEEAGIDEADYAAF